MSGRGRLTGGIMPARSLVTSFSPRSGCWPIVARSRPVMVSPPALALSLWQPRQYLLMTAFAAGKSGCAAAAVDFTGAFTAFAFAAGALAGCAGADCPQRVR